MHVSSTHLDEQWVTLPCFNGPAPLCKLGLHLEGDAHIHCLTRLDPEAGRADTIPVAAAGPDVPLDRCTRCVLDAHGTGVGLEVVTIMVVRA